MRITLIIFIYLFSNVNLIGQRLDDTKIVRVTLEDGTAVVLMADSEKPDAYYYMPVNLRLSTSENGNPMCTYFRKKDEENSFSLLTFFLEFGLNDKQEKELESAMRKQSKNISKNPKLIGPFENFSNVDTRVISSILYKENYQIGPSPSRSEEKLVVSAMLYESKSDLLDEMFNSSHETSDISVMIEFFYPIGIDEGNKRFFLTYNLEHSKAQKL